MSFGGPTLLLQRDRRRQPLEGIDFGHPHLVEKPPGTDPAVGRTHSVQLVDFEPLISLRWKKLHEECHERLSRGRRRRACLLD
jgi:hypothetical protein